MRHEWFVVVEREGTESVQWLDMVGLEERVVVVCSPWLPLHPCSPQDK